MQAWSSGLSKKAANVDYLLREFELTTNDINALLKKYDSALFSSSNTNTNDGGSEASDETHNLLRGNVAASDKAAALREAAEWWVELDENAARIEAWRPQISGCRDPNSTNFRPHYNADPVTVSQFCVCDRSGFDVSEDKTKCLVRGCRDPTGTPPLVY